MYNSEITSFITAFFKFLDLIRFQLLTDDQSRLVFEVKKDEQGRSFLLELNQAIGCKEIHLVV